MFPDLSRPLNDSKRGYFELYFCSDNSINLIRATFTSSAWFWSRIEAANSVSLSVQRGVPKGKENLSIGFYGRSMLYDV